MEIELHQKLLTAHNQRDDVAFDAVLQQMINDGLILPTAMERAVKQWITSNHIVNPEYLRWGRFPLGMVQGWIDRATRAEQELRNLKSGADNA